MGEYDVEPLAYKHPELKETYDSLLDEYGAPGTVIVVGGRTKNGSSTIANILSENFDMDVFHGGDFFRKMATDVYPEKSEEIALAQLEEQIQEDRESVAETLGTDPDVQLEKIGYETLFSSDNGIVLESRLAPWYAPEHTTLQIDVTCPLETAAQRLYNDPDSDFDAVEQARTHIVERRERLKNRYMEQYGIDIADTAVFDYSIRNDMDLDVIVDEESGLHRRDEIVRQVEQWMKQAA